MGSRGRLSLASALVVAAIVVGVGLIVAGTGPREAHTQNHQQAPANSGSLDDVPGLGRGQDAADRDEMIAYWESWKRATHVSHCMKQAGFTWHLELDYPTGESANVAAAMGVKPSSTPPQPDPETANAQYVRSLTDPQRDSYYQALYGESAADMEEAAESGAVPRGREDFAEGGCQGEAWQTVGTIWDLKDRLTPALDQMRRDARHTAAFTAKQAEYADCAETHGADVASRGELEEKAVAIDVMERVVTECDHIWDEAVTAGVTELVPEFRREHADAIKRQQDRYADTVSELMNDTEFRNRVAAEAAR